MMSPTTFDIPEEIDEVVDGEFEITEDTEAEAVDGESSSDGIWAEDGTLIGQCEIIDVPFRKTVKSKATIRVVQDGDWFLTGWFWQSLLKKPGLDNQGAELTKCRSTFMSKTQAVHSALTEMAQSIGGFDNRIKDDILKFRDTDWHLVDNAEEIAQEQRDCEALADGTGPRHPDEPKANEHGVFDTDVETVAIPLPKSWKVTAEMRLAQDSLGWWRFGYSYGAGTNCSSGPVKLTNERFPSRKQCQLAAIKDAIGHFTPIDLKIADKIAVLHNTVERDAVETITATDPETEADFQDAVQEIETAGGSVGESTSTPASEDELQAKAEAEFRRKYVAAAELMADAVLERRHAEEIFKTAKAKEKMCGDMLEQLADRGPERLPLMEYAERDKSKAETAAPVAPAVDSEAHDRDAWKSASISELDLPKGLTEKLIGDGIDTIGRLEQRRADIAAKREKWPKGVGKAAIDKIEDAVLVWLENNQPIEAGESATTETEAAATEPAAEDSTSQIDPEIGDVEARLRELYDDLDFEADQENGSYQSGHEACDRGDELAECPLTPGEDQDQWLIGWSDAKEADREVE